LPSIADVLLRCREQAVWASDEDRPFCQLPIILVHTRYSAGFALALQLPFCFEVRALSDRLVSSTPE
jgi:hypothetical protein